MRVHHGLFCAALLLALLPLMLLPGGCTVATAPEENAAAALPELRVMMFYVDTEYFDPQPVEDAVNAWIAPLLGCTVELCFVSSDSYARTLSQQRSQRAPMDVFSLYREDAQAWREAGLLLELSDVAADIAPALSPYMDISALEGEVYTLPTVHEQGVQYAFEYRMDIAARCGVDMSAVHTLADLTEVFARVQAADPEVVPLGGVSDTLRYDPLGDSLGVLMDPSSPEVTNLYASDAFYEQCALYRLWHERGYVLDTLSVGPSINYYVNTQNIFGKFANGHPYLLPSDSNEAGEPIGMVSLDEVPLKTTQSASFSWAVSSSTEHPELAKALLARMYTDPVLADLLINGVEGMHYEVEPETGLIHFPEGVTAQNNGYSQFRGWAWPNQTIAHSWSGGSDDPAGDLRAFNASCEVSIAYSFSFDSAPVAGAARRCQEVVSYYLPMLEAGVGDETLLDSFLAELEEAGIGEVIQEKQRQLDAWLAAREAGERA